MKALIVAHASSSYRISPAYAIRRLLQHFGIDADVAVTSDVQAAGGKSYINSRYDFCIVVEYRRATDTVTTGNEAYSWLSYSPGDKPIFYLGGQVRGSTPADFPVIPFNSADSSTYYRTETGQYATDEMRKVGSCVKRPDNSAYIWGRFANYVWPSTPTEYGYYRVDAAKLDANREVMWVLDASRMGIATPPSNHAVVVRYYNRYFLPMCGYDGQFAHHQNPYSLSARMAALSLLLWCMSREGIKPLRRIPVWFEIDHPLGTGGNAGYTIPQRLSILQASTEWLRDFCIQNGIPFIMGVATNFTRDATWGHYKTLQDYPTQAQPIHNILLEMENRGLWFPCWHDHSFELGAGAATYTRHSGGSYGAPVNINHTDAPFGTGSSASVILRSATALRVHIEDQLRWMSQLGFKNAWGDRHINFANNSYGGWQVLKILHDEYGLLSCRALSYSHTVTCSPAGSYRDVAYNSSALLKVHGVDIIQSADFHYNADNGLYYGSGDLNSSMSLGATSAQQAYRRFMAWAVDRWLSLVTVALGVAYWHDTACKSASLTQPTSRFLDTGSYNAYVELVSEFHNAVSLLSDWLVYGRPSDMRDYRAWLRSRIGHEVVR